MIKFQYKVIISFLMVLGFCSILLAATTGKISGTVIDSETGEPVAGANIFIEGTTLGSASDEQGDYFILKVPPGTYTVKATMISYETIAVTDVKVNVDRTTTVDFNMVSSVLAGEEITVTAQRDVIKKDVSSSQHSIVPEQIAEAPVVRVEDVIALQPGVRFQDDAENVGFTIRGSSVSEVGFNIDGVSMVDDRTQTPYIGLSRSAIQEVQILTGGFNAEYGNIRSGMVNVITKEGGDKFEFNFDYGYQFGQRKHFGLSAYDHRNNFYQTYAYGPEEKVYGGWTREESPIGRAWMGWNEFSKNTLEDSDPNNDVTPQEALEIWKWYHRGYEYGEDPDQTLDASFGGPLYGGVKYFASIWFDKSQLAYPLARDYYENLALQLKLSYNLDPSMKLSFHGMRGREEGNRAGWLDNGVLRNNNAVAGEFYNPYNEGDMSALVDNNRDIFSLKFSQVISPSTFYDVVATYSKFDSWARPMAVRDTSTNIKTIGDKEYDETPAGFLKNPDYPNDPLGYSMAVGTGTRDDSYYAGIDIKFDFTSQLNKYHLLKTGFVLNSNSYNEKRGFVGPAWEFNTTPQRIKYEETPIDAALYVQDKLEFEGFIANVGLRLQYFNPNTKWLDWDSDPFDESLASANYNPDRGVDKVQSVDSKIYVAPRIGISHPVTTRSKIFFNYGHFYQNNQPWLLYRSHFTNNAKNAIWLGNPDLKSPKTVAYELGLDYNIFGDILLHTAAYYQDITDEIWIGGELMEYTVRDFDSSVDYTTVKNDGFIDRRGIEVWLRKDTGRFYSFYVNFDYNVVSEGQRGNRFLFENPNLKNQQRRRAGESEFYPQPRLNVMLDLHTPDDWGLLSGGWRSVIIYEWEAGDRWTYNPTNEYGVSNNIQNVDRSNTNLRILKKFKWGIVQSLFYIEVQNLFNQKYLNTGHFHDSSEYLAYLNSLRGSWNKVNPGNDRFGDYKADYIELGFKEFLRYLNPRTVRFGIKFQL